MNQYTTHRYGESEAAATPTHCVFRRGLSWLALPAIAVREALPRPDMVPVPGTPSTFAGLCHVRSEFIPVLNLDSVLSEHGSSGDQIMLILDDADGPWAVLVDELSSLQSLEVFDPLSADNSAVSHLIERFRQELMELRRLPISGLFQRLQRVIRDAAKAEGKRRESRLRFISKVRALGLNALSRSDCSNLCCISSATLSVTASNPGTTGCGPENRPSARFP